MKNRGVATAIINGTIVNEGLSFKGDIIIREGLIEAIYKEGELPPLKKIGDIEIIDVEGSHIFPGVIDDQVHFREPGNAHKGTIESESAAAVLGGVTSYMDMPNNNPAATTIAALENKNSIAARHSYANYSFYLGATNENIEEIKALNKRESCGVKVFMGSSTGNMLVNNPHSLEQIFAHSPTLIATHCEEETIIRKNLKEA
ncbi:MAG: dihydroorotase, partial [Bacteroidales bacterium]